MKQFFNSQKGFTLVELLIVIAILGILAAGLLTVIDPLEQIQRGRDATRISQVNQLGNAMTAYFVAQQTYPTRNDTWITSLVDAGELKQGSPNNSDSSSVSCDLVADVTLLGKQNGFCYKTSGSGSTAVAIVYVQMQSKSQRKKATCSLDGVGTTWFVWSSADGKAGLVCTTDASTEPAPGAQTFK